MALTQDEVDDFIAMQKSVPPDTRLTWKKRNDTTYLARAGLVSRGVQRGALLLVYRVDSKRHWIFKLLRQSTELLRWDAQPPPHSHTNPTGRPPGWPGRFRDLDHEHVWHPQYINRLARPVADLQASGDHHEAFVAFCRRANIDPGGCYQPPPPPAEQLSLP